MTSPRPVSAVIDAGAVGINIEDGAFEPDLLVAKIAAARTVAANAGADLFVNARTDVYLKGLVPAEQAVGESIARAERYLAAGCDGIFVPAVVDPDEIRTIASAIAVPLNVLVVPRLPPVAELAELGVHRVSAGSAIAQAALGVARQAAARFLAEGRYDLMLDRSAQYAELNALFS